MMEGVREDYFWSYMFRFWPHGEKGMAHIMQRLDSECQRFLAFKRAEDLKQPTDHIFVGTSEGLLAEAYKRFKHISGELLDSEFQFSEPSEAFKTKARRLQAQADNVSTEKQWWQVWK